MTTIICACCGQSFLPDPRVKNQTYCSTPTCQTERRVQRAWINRNPDYLRKYRKSNSSLVQRDAAISGEHRASHYPGPSTESGECRHPVRARVLNVAKTQGVDFNHVHYSHCPGSPYFRTLLNQVQGHHSPETSVSPRRTLYRG